MAIGPPYTQRRSAEAAAFARAKTAVIFLRPRSSATLQRSAPHLLVELLPAVVTASQEISMRRSFPFLVALGTLVAVMACFEADGLAQRRSARASGTQGVLGPGLYVFQTRLDTATCEEDSTSGYVTSYFAAIDGTPASLTMTMQLTNSEHWPRWELTIDPNGRIRGMARNGALEQQFELTRDGSRFTGRGHRTYDKRVDGRMQRCRNEYDALLRKLHD